MPKPDENEKNSQSVEREYFEGLLKLFSEVGKCASVDHCIGNTYFTLGEELTDSDGEKYCSKECLENYKRLKK